MRAEQALELVARLGKKAPELAAWQDEPPQMASDTPGKKGYLHLGFARRGDRSVLLDMERHAPSLVQKALYWDEAMPHMPCVFMISTSGCILQGDRLALDIHVARDACAHVTTQSATKIHTMSHNYAAQLQRISLEENSYLEFLPDPTIPHCGSRFLTETQITLHPTASLLYSEILSSGRKYHSADGGFAFDLYASYIRAQLAGGTDIFSERYALTPRCQPLNNIGIMGPFDVFGNVILLTPPRHRDAVLARITPCYEPQKGIACGASLLPNQGGIIFKALGKEACQVKQAIRSFWQAARETITGAPLAAPFLWR